MKMLAPRVHRKLKAELQRKSAAADIACLARTEKGERVPEADIMAWSATSAGRCNKPRLFEYAKLLDKINGDRKVGLHHDSLGAGAVSEIGSYGGKSSSRNLDESRFP